MGADLEKVPHSLIYHFYIAKAHEVKQSGQLFRSAFHKVTKLMAQLKTSCQDPLCMSSYIVHYMRKGGKVTIAVLLGDMKPNTLCGSLD